MYVVVCVSVSLSAGLSINVVMYVCSSLVPRPLPDFIWQPDFSPRLRDKIWEWPGEEAMYVVVCVSVSLSAGLSIIVSKYQYHCQQ